MLRRPGLRLPVVLCYPLLHLPVLRLLVMLVMHLLVVTIFFSVTSTRDLLSSPVASAGSASDGGVDGVFADGAFLSLVAGGGSLSTISGGCSSFSSPFASSSTLFLPSTSSRACYSPLFFSPLFSSSLFSSPTTLVHNQN